jgi:pyruvate dehydrogenase E1 component alpha subunit
MHLGDLSKGIVPAVAIVGGGVPIATGAALAFKMNKEPRVAVAFSGDGAVNEGAFHEGLNMGAIWDLPVVYVVENNLYGASTPINSVIKTKNIAARGAAYGIPSATVDGNDVLAVYEAARQAVERARQGHGPTLLELMTYRLTGHSRRDPCHYQPQEERRQALEKDPLKRFSQRLLDQQLAEPAALEALEKEIEQELEAAVKTALAAPAPQPADALADMFVEEP